MASSITPRGSYDDPSLTTEELLVMFRPRRKQGSRKCLVYALFCLVFLLAALVIASFVMRVTSPEVELRSPKLIHISYRTSPSPFFNLSMVLHLAIKNNNYGCFFYEQNSVSVLYRGTIVGAAEIGSGRVKAGETKQMKLVLEMRSTKILVPQILVNDLNSGMLKFRSYAKLSGSGYLLNVVNKTRTTLMACTIYLNLTSHSVYHFQCQLIARFISLVLFCLFCFPVSQCAVILNTFFQLGFQCAILLEFP